MRHADPQPKPAKPAIRTPLNFLRREEGTTAIEFAMVAVPFFMFIFGIMAVSTYFFIMTSIEKGMDQASRSIRTGQAQSEDWTVGQFKREVCRRANSKTNTAASTSDTGPAPSDSGWVNCNDMQIFVQTFGSWADVTPKNCLTNGKPSVNTASSKDKIATYSGESSAIVLVTTCYKWKFAAKIPYIDLGQMSDGSMMMQSAASFRNEPYATE